MIKVHNHMDKEKHMDTIVFAKKYWDERVSILLAQLAEYEKKSKEYEAWKAAEKRKPKRKLGEGGGWQNFGTPKNAKFEEELAEIGDAMKFDNPYVWIKYKGFAYGGHANPEKRMDTLSDFVEHMKKEVICPKRFAAVNRELLKRHEKDLASGLVPLETSLTEVADYAYILELSLDPHFISMWCAHEYDAQGKWVKWNPGDVHGGANLTRCC
jgi:hypothetical protein